MTWNRDILCMWTSLQVCRITHIGQMYDSVDWHVCVCMCIAKLIILFIKRQKKEEQKYTKNVKIENDTREHGCTFFFHSKRKILLHYFCILFCVSPQLSPLRGVYCTGCWSVPLQLFVCPSFWGWRVVWVQKWSLGHFPGCCPHMQLCTKTTHTRLHSPHLGARYPRNVALPLAKVSCTPIL